MVSLRSPEEIQPRISRRLGEDLGSGHDLGQIESDHRLAPFHQGGRNDGSRSPLVAPETTIRPQVARQRRFFSGKSPPLLSRMTSAPSPPVDRKSTRLNSSHANISYAVFCLKKKKKKNKNITTKKRRSQSNRT